jgi:hypothetical protein
MRIIRSVLSGLVIALVLAGQAVSYADAETRGAALASGALVVESDPGDPGLPPDP